MRLELNFPTSSLMGPLFTKRKFKELLKTMDNAIIADAKAGSFSTVGKIGHSHF